MVVCPRVHFRSRADVITQPSLPLSEEKGTLLLISPPSVDRVANGRHPFLFAALKRDPLVEGDDYAYVAGGEGGGWRPSRRSRLTRAPRDAQGTDILS